MANTKRKSAEWLDVWDVCELYGVTRLTVYRWIKAGKLKGKKAGRKWLFSKKAVMDVLE